MTTVPVPNRLAVPVALAGQQAGTRTAALEQLRERLESGEPPEKKASRLSEEEQRLVQQAFQRSLFSVARQLPMKIRINGRGERQAPGQGLPSCWVPTWAPLQGPFTSWDWGSHPRTVSRPESHMVLLWPLGSQLTKLTKNCLRQHPVLWQKRGVQGGGARGPQGQLLCSSSSPAF